MQSSEKKQTFFSLKTGSLVRVNLAGFEGTLALGVVADFQTIYTENGVTSLIWVDMLIDGHKRPFEAENLTPLPRIQNGFDHAFIADLMKEAA